MMKALQKLGRSLMLPVAVLPAAAILAGIGNWILGLTSGSAANVIGTFLLHAGTSILDHLGILFAVGIAIGLSKDKHGAAALSGLVGFLVVSNLISTDTVAGLLGVDAADVDPAFAQNDNVFIGILSGVISASMYNRFSGVKLPDALAFFSGKRLAPIMAAAAMVVMAAVLFFVWPVVFGWLVAFGKAISSLGAVGAGLYGFFNRLLIPTGLHHALNSVFWFDVAGINDIGNFLKGTGEKGVTGMYQAGFFPIMMFGLPAAALAMYHTAKTKRKKQAASLMLAAAFAAFFTGVTEPLEFSFMFLAPALYVVHAILTGLSLFIAATFHWTSGFGFSAGLVDYTLSFINPLANKPYMLIIQGLVFAVIYYFLFRFLITKFNLKTPGREDEQEVAEEDNVPGASDDKFAIMAAKIYDGLGGDQNVDAVDYCTTRLRVEVKDMDQVDQDKIKSTGVPGINVVGKHSIQVIVGTSVQFVADEVNKIRK
ncbi:N-acetylglucosamine-specific PTS transporter subunit IIBC [Virgibacillus halophilus]|uniref:N-acetylglucosamine-specific PTS transporter subunit IIBC n=1 Tax=Tigheibacillus halophilus TaxID=361280 RepID=A0ABU5C8U3_9BACI|nr:N-acetylglucosamine-specific PTS transporter subunit IIBC [Virgibacillus halophilus]